MPNRILKETICTSETIDALSADAEVFFYRLLVRCDDFGRMDARANILRAACFPLRLDSITDKQVSAWRDELAANDLLWVYVVEGHSCLQITKWDSHQQRRAKYSKYAQPPARDSNCNHMQSIASNNLQEKKSATTPSVFTENEHDSNCNQLLAIVSEESRNRGIEIGASAPTAISQTPAMPQLEKPMDIDTMDTILLAHASKDPTTKTILKQRCSDNAKDLMVAFYESSGIPFTKSWLAAANEMDGVGVRSEDVKSAHKKLTADKMSVVDLYSVKKTAIALAAGKNHKQPPRVVRMIEVMDGNGVVSHVEEC